MNDVKLIPGGCRTGKALSPEMSLDDLIEVIEKFQEQETQSFAKPKQPAYRFYANSRW